MPLLTEGGVAVLAAIAGAQAVEDDPEVNSVGYGGLGDAAGNVTLDACVMEGTTLRGGGVAGVANIRHVAALAKCVMDHLPHNLLVGLGAQQFALQHGFPLESLHTPKSIEQWQKTKPKPGDGPQRLPDPAKDHDTVTVLARDGHSHFGGACSTSGLAHKRPGRVGDSPLIGHGLYVDDEAGAAGATGVGEEISRIVGSFYMTELMRSGKSAQEACEAVVKRVIELARRRGVEPARVAFLALDREGGYGGACTKSTDFVYAVGRQSGVEIVRAVEM